VTGGGGRPRTIKPADGDKGEAAELGDVAPGQPRTEWGFSASRWSVARKEAAGEAGR
jgi:hypothetical protein